MRDRLSSITRRPDRTRVVLAELLALSVSKGDCTVRIWNPEDGSTMGTFQVKFGGFSDALRMFVTVDWKSVGHLHSF